VRKLLWLLVPAAALLVGCFNLENSYVINEDGSGTQSVRFAIPIEVLEGLGGELPSIEDTDSDPDIQALREALGDQGSITFFSNEEEGFGMEVILHAPASDDFSAAIAEVIAGLPEDSEIDFEDLLNTTESIQRDGDTWTFERELAPLSTDDVASLTGDPDSAGVASLFLDESVVTVRLLLPGTVKDHNADEVLEDGTLVWTQSGVDPTRTLTATSELGGGSNNLRLILIVAAVLAAAAVMAVVAYFATRGGSDEKPPAEPAA
jgi:hypothetical protein